MSESLMFKLSTGKEISIPIRRSDRAKHIRMRQSARGDFSLTAPSGLPYGRLLEMAPEFLKWVEKKSTRQNLPPLQKFPDIVQIPFTGQEYKIEKGSGLADGRRNVGKASLLVSGKTKRILINLENGSLVFYGYLEDEDILAQALRLWMRKLAQRLLPPKLEELAKRGNYGEIKIAIRDQKTRWGSCARSAASQRPTISLNWRGLLLTPPLFEHLCWHELTHLKYMNHSREFHVELARHSPRASQNEKTLNDVWRNLPFWAIPD